MQTLLKETVSLLKEMRSKQSSTDGCVIEGIDRAVRNIQAIKCKEYTEQEVATIVLKELGLLFSELPEVKRQFMNLADRKSQ